MSDNKSELVIHAASRIYAGMIASGNVTSRNNSASGKYALSAARKLVDVVDHKKPADGEVPFPW